MKNTKMLYTGHPKEISKMFTKVDTFENSFFLWKALSRKINYQWNNIQWLSIESVFVQKELNDEERMCLQTKPHTYVPL